MATSVSLLQLNSRQVVGERGLDRSELRRAVQSIAHRKLFERILPAVGLDAAIAIDHLHPGNQVLHLNLVPSGDAPSCCTLNVQLEEYVTSLKSMLDNTNRRRSRWNGDSEAYATETITMFTRDASRRPEMRGLTRTATCLLPFP